MNKKEIPSSLKEILKNENVQKLFNSITVILVSISAFALVFKADLQKEVEGPTKELDVDIAEIKGAVEGNSKKLREIFAMKKVSLYEGGLVTPDSLISVCEEGKTRRKECNIEIARITKTVSVFEGIHEGYLYIKAGVSRKGEPISSLTQYDSVWFLFDDSDFSGQLLRSKAIYNGQSSDGYTEMVFDLSQIPLTHLPYSDDRKPDDIPSALEKLITPGEYILAAFVSTLGYGKLQVLDIFYKGGNIEVLSSF